MMAIPASLMILALWVLSCFSSRVNLAIILFSLNHYSTFVPTKKFQFYKYVMNKYFILISLAIILANSDILAQKDFKSGYILTNSGDTIKGFIDLQNPTLNSMECVFSKEEEGDNSIKYKPGEIKEYRVFNHRYYISKKVSVDSSEKDVFLEFLVNGKAKLYYLKDYSYEYFYLEKEDSELVELSNEIVGVEDKDGNRFDKESKKYIGIMSFYLADAPNIQSPS